MPYGDFDDDLFDPPQPKRIANPSKKIVHQPAGVQWSLSRLPEVETAYQTAFKKRLPLVNKGQGGIHNKWGYDHRDSADVSINPSTPEGQQFIEQLKKQNVPFLAFTGAIPGVATGPHVHIGFPSHRTGKKFNIGAQRKDAALASSDLFDSPSQPSVSDDDLFDPPTVNAPAGKKPSPFARVKAGAGAAQVDDWRPQSMRSQKKLFETPLPQPRRSLLGDATTALPGVHQILRLLPEEDRENIVEGVTGAVSGTAKQLANTQELGLKYTPYGIAGRKLASQAGLDANRIPQALRGVEHALGQEVAENEAARPAPTTFAGNVRRGVGKGVGAASIELPKLILGGRVLGAANLPVQGALSRADEGYSGLAKGAAGGLVYHYGGQLTGKAFSGLSPYLAKVGNSLVWIAGPVAEHQLVAKATGSEPPNLAQSIGENIPFGIVAGMGARGKVRVKTRSGERDATEADLPKILNKELEVVPPERESVPSVPERPETIKAQLDARGYSLIPTGAPRPSIPRGYRAERMSDGVVYYDPSRISRETIRNTPTTELLGHVEPKSEATTEAVVARTPEGTELQSSAVSPENVSKQVELTAEQYPGARVETGGSELAKRVIEERLNAGQAEAQRQGVSPEQPVEAVEGQPVVPTVEAPQRFYHTQYGNVVRAADQTGARKGKTRVYVEGNPEEIHYPKTVDLRGRGNERMVPLKESAEVPPKPPVETPQQPSETKGALPATPPSPDNPIACASTPVA